MHKCCPLQSQLQAKNWRRVQRHQRASRVRGAKTQVHLGNTMPPACQSATMDTDKNINRYSSAKRSIQFTEDGATNKEGQQQEHLQDTQVHLQVVKKHKQE
ncbi:uncharacterized protein LOC119281220 [Triticum dicoccoides]|uniref:uncharacterized protein LOC119281220 n=1 Tax=Triticum dicoccoides TaxID=85692 RepID=UPI0018902A3A|nr:uncharacterized protein LOC119281220 [Triticum dicoccoides]